ncbi:hypothetical protein HMPREF9625_00967 [Oribacterium parvum ACB1]|uniref:EAL domain-containing protein n=1 Tax=Oribacterium parvum ACB1 TaxID=796943 RepID=G9WNN4_9FIRM|nr:bifunctional diguanylate cyclase/phosphodiesterase [Oribacterium parvum]EHL10771.1 hypothetical protein HMPREF9625_00967 [Oribacterium parvum ACB1]EJF11975.1 cyclic diguanylate phosphodiesterase (EAL) domain protein [Oribacterium parvum ACB8]
MNSNQNPLLPKWIEKRNQLREGDFDSLSKTIKNQLFRELATEFMEEGQLLCYFNIVDFKLYNDRFGFEMGDALLVEMANILQKAFPDALITRMFADQFALLSKEKDCVDTLISAHEDFLNLKIPMALDFKVGIYSISAKKNIINACDRAKTACDCIKKERAVFYRFYDEELSHLLLQHRFIVDHIEKAIENGDIYVYYQPLIRALSKEVCGLEALVRWIDPQFGMFSPAEFIPVLEEYHLIHLLDIHVISLICQEFAAIRERGEEMIPVSLNLSRMDFELCDIFGELEKLVEKYQVPRELLTLEITESVLSKSPALISSRIKRFHEAGYKVWMDDFGSGYSSLNVLKDFDFDLIKIDMMLLQDSNEKSRKIISSIVDMAKKIGIRTLAEGVETEEQLDFLREIGCEKLQGYYIGRPGPYQNSILHCKENGFRFESPGKRQYNDDLGYINLLSNGCLPPSALEEKEDIAPGIPLSIVEMLGDRIEFLYVNQSFQRELAIADGLSVQETERLINDKNTAQYKQIRSFLSALSEGGGSDMDTIEGDSLCSIRGKEISHIPGRNAYLLNIQVYRGDFLKLKQKKMMDKVKDLYNGYELVLLWNPSLGQNELLYEKSHGSLAPGDRDFLTEYAKTTFSKSEEKRFFQFLRKNNVIRDKETVKEEAFFGRDREGKKRIFLVSLKPSALENGTKVLLSVRRVWNPGIAKLVAGGLGNKDPIRKDA